MKKSLNNILVVGGAGFVGSNLCERLLHEGCHIICIDNLYTGCLDNVKTLLDNPNFEFRQIDVADREALGSLKSLHVDEIYHWLVLLLLFIIKRMQSIQLVSL